MKHISLYNSKKWKVLIESSNEKEYTIDTRPNYLYKPFNKYWKYQKKGTSTWNWVENEESVSKLNSKYKLDLGVYKPKGFTKYKINSRPGYYYKVDPSNKHWQYYKINSTSNKWNYVENEESVKALNSKYKLDLSKYNVYKLIYKGWEDRGILAAKYLSNAGKKIGMTKMLASAFIGNFKVESGVRHNVSQISTKGLKLGFGFKPTGLETAKSQKPWAGYGIAQWTNNRKNRLISSKANTINKQLDFVIDELKDTDMWKSIKKAKTIREATRLIVEKYERAGKPNIDKRVSAAEYVYNKL